MSYFGDYFGVSGDGEAAPVDEQTTLGTGSVVDGQGQPAAGATVKFRLQEPPPDATSVSSRTRFDLVSDANGIISDVFRRNAWYVGRYENGPETPFHTGTGATFDIPPIKGRPEPL